MPPLLAVIQLQECNFRLSFPRRLSAIICRQPLPADLFCRLSLAAVAGSCSKSFWDSPLVEGPGRPVHPKTTTFCPVLGFTPSGRPCRAHQSQNDLEQLYSRPFVALPVFRTCNVRKKIGLPRTFSSGRVTLGNPQPAFQAPLWHILVFRTCNVRKKIGLPRTFSSGHVTSGTA